MNFPTARGKQNRLPWLRFGRPPGVEQLEERRLLTVVNWSGLGDGTSWGNQNNWVGNQVPGPLDDAVINVAGTPTIVFSSGTTTVKSLTSAENFTISGGSFNVTGNSSVNGAFTMTAGTLGSSGAGVTFSATSTTSVSNATLNAQAGSTISLPNLTSYSTNVQTQLQSTGANSQLLLPALTSLSTTGNNAIQIRATAGGHTTLAALTTIATAPVQLVSSGVGSQLDMSALTSLNGVAGFTNGLISVSDSGTFLHGAITSMNRMDIALDGAATTLSFPTLTSMTNGGLTASGGGTLNLSGLTSYANSAATYVLQATGAGSQLTLPVLTSLSTTLNSFIQVKALAGATTSMASLTQITSSPIQLFADGTGSQLNFPSLATVNGSAGTNNGLISLSAGGAFTHGAIASMDRYDISLDGASTTVSFPTLTSMTNAGLSASGGGTLNLSALTSYADNNGTRVLQSTGAGSVLSLPALTSLSTSANSFIQVKALAGGHTNFTALTQITTSPIQLFADGTGSQLDFSSLTVLKGSAGNNNGLVSLSNNGSFLHGAITTIDRVDLALDGATTTMSFPTLTSITNSNITASGGATLNLSNVTSYNDTNGATLLLQATGAGSVLSFPSLTTLATTLNGFLQIKALSGGHTDFGSLTQVTTSPIQFFSDGVGSQLNLPNLVTVNGTAGNNNGLISVSNSGTFSHGAIASIDRYDIALDGPATTISFPTLTSMTNAGLSASGGGTLNLSALTSYNDITGTRVLQSTGTGSKLLLPALTTLATVNNSFIQLKALAGGETTLAALTQITTSPIQLITDGTGSQLKLPSLVTVQGTPGANNGVIALSGGGSFTHGAITTMDRYDLSLDGAATTVSFPTLTSLTNSGLNASGGGTLNLSALSSCSTVISTQVLQSTGANSQLTLPVLTSLSTTANAFIQVKALSGGKTNLPALTQITTSPVQLISDGTNSQLDLSALTTMRMTPGNSTSLLQATNNGVVLTGNNPNTVITDSAITTSAAGSFTIGSNQTYTADKATAVVTGGTLISQGKIVVPDLRIIDINGGLTLNGQAILSSGVAGTTTITGNLLGNTQNATQFNAQGWVTLDGTGTAGTPQQLEVMSADLGAVQNGFNNNFAYGTLSLANNTYARLIDTADNATGAGAEALYVKKLVVPAGTTLDLNGLHVYVRTSQVAGNVINGTLTPVTTPAVVNRQLFYNNSPKYDVGGPPIQPFPDDNAIPHEKKALLPGAGAATYANVSSYTRGINGVIVDIAGNHGTIVPSDFVFKTGNNNTPSSWATATLPTTISLRPGAGTGSDRYEIIWADNAIQKTWLQVTIRGNDAAGGFNTNTGLATTDTFFFGNALADSSDGDGPTAFVTNATDELGARNHPAALATNIPISNLYDYNRDGRVDSSDQLASRNNSNAVATALKVITITNPPAAPDVEPAAVAMSTEAGTREPADNIAFALTNASTVSSPQASESPRPWIAADSPVQGRGASQAAHQAFFQRWAEERPRAERPDTFRLEADDTLIDDILLEWLA